MTKGIFIFGTITLLYICSQFTEVDAIELCAQTGTSGRQARDDTGTRLTAVTILEEPYVMEEGSKKIGYIPDLMKAISEVTQMTFELKLVADNVYGSYNQGTRKWNGMMGELIGNEADLIAAPFTHSQTREDHVDFTYDFMNSHLTILMLKITKTEMGIESAADLANQDRVHYGCVKSGNTDNFFQTAQADTYKKMNTHMRRNPSNLMTTLEEGVEKVKNSKGLYAFIMESKTAEYYTSRGDCDLVAVGSLKDLNYALAVQERSPHQTALNNALLELKSRNTLQELEEKWWKGNCSPNSASRVVVLASLWVPFIMLMLNL